MEIIAITAQKGGVGKTTTASAIGAGLRLRGYRVLFIDLDPQGNLTYTLRANEQSYNALGVLEKPGTIKKEIQTTEAGAILASTPLLVQADRTITQVGKEYRLKEALALLKDDYDYCIIDTPPALSILTINALTACSYVIIPAQADIYSLQGISQLNSTIETVKKYCNPDLYIKGILITRYNQRIIIRREATNMLENTAKELNTKVFKSKIREATALVEAQALRQNIFDYAPRSNASKDYKKLIDEILEVKTNGKKKI